MTQIVRVFLFFVHILAFSQANAITFYAPLTKVEYTHSHIHDNHHDHVEDAHVKNTKDDESESDHSHKHEILVTGSLVFLSISYHHQLFTTILGPKFFHANENIPSSPFLLGIFRPPIQS